jgi:hypothetical protein
MAIVEYKLNITADGVSIHPPYIKSHAFYDSVSNTHLGYVLPESERDYWVPDTLVELTEQEAVDRCVSGNIARVMNPGDTEMTDSELEQAVRDWYQSQG